MCKDHAAAVVYILYVDREKAAATWQWVDSIYTYLYRELLGFQSGCCHQDNRKIGAKLLYISLDQDRESGIFSQENNILPLPSILNEEFLFDW